MIEQNIQSVQNLIQQTCSKIGRSAASVTLVAVSKTVPAPILREAYVAGIRHFGENYVQEGLAKLTDLADLRSKLHWHFIGPLQSNKTREIAEQFDWVHSIDRLKIAQRLAQQRPPGLAPLQVCIQVNISGETSKSGVHPSEVLPLAQAVCRLPQLTLRGLMVIPQPSEDSAEQRKAFLATRQLFATLQAQGLAVDTLSMGMSHDIESALLEGSTLLRVGTAIFGARTSKAT